MYNSRVGDESIYDPSTMVGGKKTRVRSSAKQQGGALMNDIGNLAVPFAILLAKQGLEHMNKKSAAKTADTKAKTTSASKTAAAKTAASRRKAAAGGSCGSQCATKSGGSSSIKDVQERFKKIANEIDSFLRKN